MRWCWPICGVGADRACDGRPGASLPCRRGDACIGWQTILTCYFASNTLWGLPCWKSLERCYLIPGIPARRAGQSAPADRDRRGGGGPRQCPCALSGALPVGGGDESLPLRLSQRSGAGLRARAQMRRGLPVAHFRAPVRPHRHACRGGGRFRQRPLLAAARRRQRRGGGAGGGGARRSSASASRSTPSAPMPRPKANCWTWWRRPMRRAPSC